MPTSISIKRPRTRGGQPRQKLNSYRRGRTHRAGAVHFDFPILQINLIGDVPEHALQHRADLRERSKPSRAYCPQTCLASEKR